MTEKQKENKKLIERYPFLQPRNIWTDKIPEDYDYSYTRLDELEPGWKVAFGEELCAELKDILVEANYLEQFRFSQIKEKYGHLCLYNFGAPEKAHQIIRKYEKLSKRICGHCGAPATQIGRGWLYPYCDNCQNPEDCIPINEYYEEDE